MIISNKYKFTFFCPTGNCATTSIYKSLLPFHDERKVINRKEYNFNHDLNSDEFYALYGFENTREPEIGWHDSISKNHVSYPERIFLSVKHMAPNTFFDSYDKKFEDFFHFSNLAVVRNPWDLILSIYNKNFSRFGRINLQDKNSFEINRCQIAIKGLFSSPFFKETQYKSLCVNNHSVLFANQIIRFENLQEGFSEFCHKTNIPVQELSHEQNNHNAVQKKYQNVYSDEAADLVNQMFSEDIKFFNYNF